MNAVANRQDPFDFGIAFPNSRIISTEHESGADTAFSNDGIQDATSAKTIIVAPKAMVLQEEYPWSLAVFSDKQLIVGSYAIGKKEGDSKVYSSTSIIVAFIALHD